MRRVCTELGRARRGGKVFRNGKALTGAFAFRSRSLGSSNDIPVGPHTFGELIQVKGQPNGDRYARSVVDRRERSLERYGLDVYGDEPSVLEYRRKLRNGRKTERRAA